MVKMVFRLLVICILFVSELAICCTENEALKIGKTQIKADLKSRGIAKVRFNGYAAMETGGNLILTGEFFFKWSRPGYVAEHVGSYRIENCHLAESGWGSLGDEESTN